LALLHHSGLAQHGKESIQYAGVASADSCLPLMMPVRRQLFLLLDDNYFSRSTTITPDLFGGREAQPRRGGRSPRVSVLFFS
jgi:hypothetical protein